MPSTPNTEDADGYREAWARGGYSKADYMRNKAYWASVPKHVMADHPPLVSERERAARIVESYARGCITIPLTQRIAQDIRGSKQEVCEQRERKPMSARHNSVNRTETVSVRVTPETLRRLREAAHDRRVTVSHFIDSAIVMAVGGEENQMTRCDGCIFWAYFGEGETDIGHCHRHAPIPEPEDTIGDASTFWPRTRASDWCGEFSAAPEPA